MLTLNKGVGSVAKYIKIIMYVLTAYIIITIINSALLCFEFALAMAPDVIGVPNDWDIDTVVWIMIGINFVISAFSYIYAGMKMLKTNCIAFNVVMLFLPFVFACIGCIILELEAYDGWGVMACILNSSLGIFIIFVHNSFIKYAVAIFPSVCMTVGYIIKTVHKRERM